MSDGEFWKDQAEYWEGRYRRAFECALTAESNLELARIENKALRAQVAKLVRERISRGPS